MSGSFRLTVILAVVLVLSIMYAPGGGAERLEADNSLFAVHLEQSEEVEPGIFRFQFEFRDKASGKSSGFTLQNRTAQVRRLGLYRSKLIVIGTPGSAAWAVTVIDLSQGQETDFFICGTPELSHSQRYLVYRKFIPNSAPQEVSDLVLVYDFAKTPNANRIAELAADRLNTERVGYPLYPTYGSGNEAFNVWVEKEEERHSIIGGEPIFGWLDADKRLVFLDRHQGKDWLVMADISEGVAQASITRCALTAESVAQSPED